MANFFNDGHAELFFIVFGCSVLFYAKKKKEGVYNAGYKEKGIKLDLAGDTDFMEARKLNNDFFLNSGDLAVIIRNTIFMNKTSKVSDTIKGHHRMMPGVLAIVDALGGRSNECLHGINIRRAIFLGKTHNDQIATSLTMSHGHESLARVRVTFKKTNSERQFSSRLATEDTHVGTRMTWIVVDDISNKVVLFSSTLVSTRHLFGNRISFNHITKRLVLFSSQRFSNQVTLVNSGRCKRKSRDLTTLTNTIKTKTLETTIYSITNLLIP